MNYMHVYSQAINHQMSPFRQYVRVNRCHQLWNTPHFWVVTLLHFIRSFPILITFLCWTPFSWNERNNKYFISLYDVLNALFYLGIKLIWYHVL